MSAADPGASASATTARPLWIGSDHAAIALRDGIAAHLRERGFDVHVIGPKVGEKADYPDCAVVVAEAVAQGKAEHGVLCCGTGIGVSIAANKVPGIRAALVHDPVTARLAAQHNGAQIICMGGRLLAVEYGVELVDTWLATTFEARHQVRLDKIAAYEQAHAPAPAADPTAAAAPDRERFGVG